MAVQVDLQAELTIVSACQTKHLTPFQYEFDIQYSTTRGGQCYVVCRQLGVSLLLLR